MPAMIKMVEFRKIPAEVSMLKTKNYARLAYPHSRMNLIRKIHCEKKWVNLAALGTVALRAIGSRYQNDGSNNAVNLSKSMSNRLLLVFLAPIFLFLLGCDMTKVKDANTPAVSMKTCNLEVTKSHVVIFYEIQNNSDQSIAIGDRLFETFLDGSIALSNDYAYIYQASPQKI